MSLDEALASSKRPDYEQLDRMTDADIAQQIARNPDTMEFTDEMFAQATWVEPPSKHLLSLRIDRDVIDWFRRTGRNYQSRMNAVLRSYMQHAARRAARELARLGGSDPTAKAARRRRSRPSRAT